jgi:hypothetical protein
MTVICHSSKLVIMITIHLPSNACTDHCTVIDFLGEIIKIKFLQNFHLEIFEKYYFLKVWSLVVLA